MKKPIIIVFVVILVIHLLGLTLFLLLQKKDNTDVDKDNAPELIPEPILIPESSAIPKSAKRVKNPRPSKSVKSSTQSTSVRKVSKSITAPSGGFFVPAKIPTFNFRGAVSGNLSAVPETKNASAGILVDLSTGKVLWSKNAKKAVPIASMTKMMTVLIAVEDIRDGKMDYNQVIKVTKSAASIGGSDIWLDPRESFPVKDLLKAILIKSANDAAFLVGEYLGGGDINKFVARMNSRAAALGMHAKYFNPHGLPGKSLSKDNAATPEGLAKLAATLLQYPDVVKLSSTPIAYIDRKIGRNKKTMLTSTNKLVRSGVKGVDGMKTGYTRRAGFCLTATCRRDGRRMIAVVTGFRSSKERNTCVKKLLDWGYKR